MSFRTSPQPLVELTPTIVPKDLATSISTYFRHNWEEPITVRTSWRTYVLGSKLRAKEQRIGIWSRPQITVSSLHQAMDYPQLRRLVQHGSSQSPSFTVPVDSPSTLLSGTGLTVAGALYCDMTPILGVTTNGGGDFVLEVFRPFLDDRFYPGTRLWVVPDGDGEVEVSSGVSVPGVLHTAVGVDRYEIIVTPVGTFTPEAGMLLVPAFDAMPVLTVDGEDPTCATPTFQLETVEQIGESQLLSSRNTNVYAFFPNYQNYPTFAPDHNFREEVGLGFSRDGNTFDLGSGQQSVLDGERPLHTNNFTLSAERTTFWRFKYLFDSRRGSLLPMWIVTPSLLQPDYVHPGGTLVPLLPDSAVEFPQYLGFKSRTSGDSFVRKIVTMGADYTLEEALDADTYDIVIAYLGRFTEDWIDEEWITCHYAECTFSTVELADDSVQELVP